MHAEDFDIGNWTRVCGAPKTNCLRSRVQAPQKDSNEAMPSESRGGGVGHDNGGMA